MRELILDTETTNLDYQGSGRIVEIGIVELVDRYQTGEEYHQYINPEAEVSEAALKVHGLDNSKLEQHPTFSEIVDGLLEFIGQDLLVVHNAKFDRGFLNKELALAGRELLPAVRVFDTLDLARSTLPQRAQHNLDALCRYYRIDGAGRELHGALIDARLLAEVYLRLLQDSQGDGDMLEYLERQGRASSPQVSKKRRRSISAQLTDAERQAHRKYVEKTLGPNALWLNYLQ
ncbi:MAG: DNA polymerase III subunit epsilon [Rhodobacteraceae bacterium]|nr:DNA polymerase III subunit epsilon [Paracoccaceae bacterium]